MITKSKQEEILLIHFLDIDITTVIELIGTNRQYAKLLPSFA